MKLELTQKSLEQLVESAARFKEIRVIDLLVLLAAAANHDDEDTRMHSIQFIMKCLLEPAKQMPALMHYIREIGIASSGDDNDTTPSEVGMIAIECLRIMVKDPVFENFESIEKEVFALKSILKSGLKGLPEEDDEDSEYRFSHVN